MKSIYKRILAFLGIMVLALGAAWVVWPDGSRINLNPLKIKYEKQLDLKLGLDLKGGSRLIYQADFTGVSFDDKKDAMNSVRDTIERRVNSFNVSEPLVQVQGEDQIVVELPGIQDINEAIKLIGQTPLLEFRLENPNAGEPQAKVGADGKITIDPLYGWEPTGLSGKQLKKARADVSAGTSALSQEIVVALVFDDEGSKLFGELTANNIGRRIAIVLDGQIISAPTVQSAITNGEAIISGGFQSQEAKELATRLNSGALPVPIKLVSQQNVGATLGQESVNKSVIAGLLGLLLIAVFMLAYYRLPGLLAVVALAIYVIISVAIFKIGISFTAVMLVGVFFLLGLTVSAWFGALALVSYLGLLLAGGLAPVTLTLAGIAGFILSIGMAVDANILIFERLKEEVRAGKDISKAIDDGFARAWLSIRDSNVSSLITTFFLYLLGTPAIKGFAVTLSIGILISMFTAISVTRTFLKLFITNRMLKYPSLFGSNLVIKQKSDHK